METLTGRTKELLGRFGRQLSMSSFSVNGMPAEEEIRLTKEIWNSLTDSEKTRICDKIKAELMEKYGVKKHLPDPTPYAMRLTHRYLEVMQQKADASPR